MRAAAALAWVFWMAVHPIQGQLDGIARILGLAILVGIPLAIDYVHGPHPLFRTIEAFWLPAGLLAVFSLTWPPGSLSTALAVPWLVEALLLMAWAVYRKPRRLEEALFSVGFAYLPVGAIWLIASRWGHGLLGFTEPLVLLTAVHFHFAGCLAPCLAGAIGRALSNPRFYRILAIGIAAGPPLVALGILGNVPLELVSGTILGSCLFGLALLLLGPVRDDLPGLARLGATVSALCGLGAMLLAISYAARSMLPQYALTIPQMAETHGLLNSVGFTIVGLWSCQKWRRVNSIE
ncbi:MAG TPA: YndJ family protein [Candidatus Xenobia bacterium]|jgi:hypothetical protein